MKKVNINTHCFDCGEKLIKLETGLFKQFSESDKPKRVVFKYCKCWRKK